MHRDLQPHLLPPHALRRLESLAMAHYPIRILDVGCGNGQWYVDVAAGGPRGSCLSLWKVPRACEGVLKRVGVRH
jgi:tRNA G46 methylase TrmB